MSNYPREDIDKLKKEWIQQLDDEKTKETKTP